MAKRPQRSHARGPQPLGEAAWTLVRTLVPADVIRLMHARAAWERVGVPWLRGRAFPVAVVRDELIVHVLDSQYHHELMYLRQELLHKLQALAPAARLARLRLRLGEFPPPLAPPPPEPPRPRRTAPILPPEPSPATADALQAVADPELRQAIAGARVMLGRA